MATDQTEQGIWERARAATEYCLERRHLLWTGRIALAMGIVYTVINQLDVILEGHASELLLIKVPLNFLAPFLVANIGLLGARART